MKKPALVIALGGIAGDHVIDHGKQAMVAFVEKQLGCSKRRELIQKNDLLLIRFESGPAAITGSLACYNRWFRGMQTFCLDIILNFSIY